MNFFDTGMRESLIEKQLARMQAQEDQPGDRVCIQEFSQLYVHWIADMKLQNEAVTSAPSDVAAAIARHSDDGELSIHSPEGEELLIANRGYVLMCRDISYWKTLNEVLEMEDFEHEQTGVEAPDIDLEMKGM